MQQPLSDIERRILQVIDEEGVIRGSVLRRRARVENPAELLEAVLKLLDQRLIAVSGGVADERSMQEAYFSPVPSTRGLVKEAVSKR
jgi:hypothetical protein